MVESLNLARRQFLRRLGIASGAVAGVSLVRELDAFGGPKRRLEVVIVGAGLAGLVAAYELEQRGHQPISLEAEQCASAIVATGSRPPHGQLVLGYTSE